MQAINLMRLKGGEVRALGEQVSYGAKHKEKTQNNPLAVV
jgi:hypothetical protein